MRAVPVGGGHALAEDRPEVVCIAEDEVLDDGVGPRRPNRRGEGIATHPSSPSAEGATLDGSSSTQQVPRRLPPPQGVAALTWRHTQPRPRVAWPSR